MKSKNFLYYDLMIKYVTQFNCECFKTQKMCDKAVDNCPFVFDAISGLFKIQEMQN